MHLYDMYSASEYSNTYFKLSVYREVCIVGHDMGGFQWGTVDPSEFRAMDNVSQCMTGKAERSLFNSLSELKEKAGEERTRVLLSPSRVNLKSLTELPYGPTTTNPPSCSNNLKWRS